MTWLPSALTELWWYIVIALCLLKMWAALVLFLTISALYLILTL